MILPRKRNPDPTIEPDLTGNGQREGGRSSRWDRVPGPRSFHRLKWSYRSLLIIALRIILRHDDKRWMRARKRPSLSSARDAHPVQAVVSWSRLCLPSLPLLGL